MSYTPLSNEKKKEICSALGLPEHFADAPQCGLLIAKCGELAQENKELADAGKGYFTTQILVRSKEALEENIKLKKEIEELKHREYCLRQDSKGHSPSEVQEYRDEIEELKKQAEIREGQFELSEAVLEQKIEKLEEKEGRWEVGQAITENVIANLKKEIEELKEKATMYEYMSEYMEKAEEFTPYFDYIREYHPDKFIEAGGIVDSDEEDMEKEEQLLKAQIEGEQE
jgi:hypothetical protein